MDQTNCFLVILMCLVAVEAAIFYILVDYILIYIDSCGVREGFFNLFDGILWILSVYVCYVFFVSGEAVVIRWAT